MKKLLLGVAIAVILPSLAVNSNEGVLVVPPDEAVAGKSQAEWSEAWWQWAGSFERFDSPIADTDGSLCSSGQSGPVWFLAGTYGTGRTIRTCSVPAGKYLFFPMINYVVMPRSNRVTCASVSETAHRMTDEPSALLVDLNGLSIEDPSAHRQATVDCFDMGARLVPEVEIYPSAANGYYIMLNPLSPGRHELNFGGILPSMSQAVTYTLNVE